MARRSVDLWNDGLECDPSNEVPFVTFVQMVCNGKNSKNILVLNLQQIEHMFLHFVSVPGPMLTRIGLNKCFLKDSRNHVTVVLCFNSMFMERCYEMNFSAPCWQATKGCIETMIHQGPTQQLLSPTDCDPMQVLFCCSPNAGLTHIHWQTRTQICLVALPWPQGTSMLLRLTVAMQLTDLQFVGLGTCTDTDKR